MTLPVAAGDRAAVHAGAERRRHRRGAAGFLVVLDHRRRSPPARGAFAEFTDIYEIEAGFDALVSSRLPEDAAA